MQKSCKKADEVRMVRDLYIAGMKKKDIAKLLHLSSKQVRHRLKHSKYVE